MKYLFKILLFSFLLTTVLNAQYLINNFDGIPLISIAPYNIEAAQYDKMKEMGADFIIATELTEARLNEIINRGLKVIPLQSDPGLYNYILKYSEGAYTKWEAEGTPLGKGDATLKYNPNIAATFNSGGRQGVVTNIGAGYDTLINGPGYMQERRYWRIDTGYVDYTAAFSMLLTNTIPPESGNPNDTICILQVTDSNIECCYWPNQIFETSRVLLRSDFTPGVWQTFNLTYNFQSEESDMQQPVNQLPNYTYQNYQRNDPSNKNLADFVQFKIIWKGDQYSRLYIDNIILSDPKGNDIVTFPAVQQYIITQATQSFPNSNINNTVAAWFTIDEPETIDNFEPIRKIDSLLKASSNGKRGIWVSFPSSWNGRYGDSYFGTHGLYKSNEFAQRTSISPHQNNHPLYDYPFTQENINNYHPGDDYRDWNIKYLADTIMNKVNGWDPNFSMTLLCGRYDGASLFHDPLPHEMLYEANLKLMYGAKSLSLFRYYSDGLNPAFTGLVTYDANGYYPTSKWYMVKNILSPRLKGTFGKTLKSIHQTVQYLNHQLSTSQGFIQSIIAGNCTAEGMQAGDEAYDLGFFKDDLDRDYFMLISRWYNPGCNPALTINIKPEYFPDNYNLKVVNLINNTTLNTITKYGYIYAAPEIGDASFFSVAPVVKYGGLLAYNDTIKTNTTLSDNMTIDAGKVLQINEGKTYSITDTITFSDTSSFITGYGYINRTQNGWITTRSWNKSLFKGRSGSHPKLIWSKHPDITNVIDYNIYRNHANGGWQYLTTKSNSTFEYIDSTITIIEGMTQANETSTQYRITATHRPTRDLVETSPTNTILYHRVEGQGLEKQNLGLTSNDFTYNLDQNYPNPFNPTTTINYSIADDGIVTLEIMNILGERIKTLVNEFKTRGNHNISFNALSLASGVYVYKLQAGDFVSSKKMILLK